MDASPNFKLVIAYFSEKHGSICGNTYTSLLYPGQALIIRIWFSSKLGKIYHGFLNDYCGRTFAMSK
jgi:hypothetical protein